MHRSRTSSVLRTDQIENVSIFYKMEIRLYNNLEKAKLSLRLQRSRYEIYVGVEVILTFVLEEYIPYILESNPHPFYSFRGLKNQMRIRIACGLDLRSRAGFWKNDTAAVLYGQ